MLTTLLYVHHCSFKTAYFCKPYHQTIRYVTFVIWSCDTASNLREAWIKVDCFCATTSANSCSRVHAVWWAWSRIDVGKRPKNRRAETAYLGTLRALRLLEGELVNLRLQERSCLDCCNSPLATTRRNMSTLIILCHVNTFAASLSPMWTTPRAFLLRQRFSGNNARVRRWGRC